MRDVSKELARSQKKLALRVQKLLLDKGMTQRELARIIDMKESYMSEFLAGQVNPTLKTILLLEAGLNAKLIEFL
jgi:transcriptional regulator with XRE-family HTH domain